MKILALDLASSCGWTFGNSLVEIPTIQRWQLRREGQSLHQASCNLGCSLRDLFELGCPDQVWCEQYLDPAAHPDSDSVKIALLLRGAVDAVASCYDIPVREVNVSSARISFCGKATFYPSRRAGSGPKPGWMIVRDLRANKQMIWDAAVRQGYFGAGETPQFDRSDSLCVWSYAACRVGGRAPPLVLT